MSSAINLLVLAIIAITLLFVHAYAKRNWFPRNLEDKTKTLAKSLKTKRQVSGYGLPILTFSEVSISPSSIEESLGNATIDNSNNKPANIATNRGTLTDF